MIERTMAAANMRMRMQLRKGIEVEVQRWDNDSYSWLSGDVVSGNDHYYVVRIRRSTTSQGAVLKRVPCKFIRTQPVPIGLYNWSPCDEVESFTDHTWSPPVVSAIGYKKVIVYLLGKMKKVRVRTCELRLRRQWVDNQWALVDKHSAFTATAIPEPRVVYAVVTALSISDQLQALYNHGNNATNKGKELSTCLKTKGTKDMEIDTELAHTNQQITAPIPEIQIQNSDFDNCYSVLI
ncbi:hypothetical protein ZIOFF_005636 [Zingiber officinale]|uniref:Uncharacterized protein n=1 Tax=Zingiber officinale TaxID=94328 RepID=A0A8J5IAA9_ZINOF|nr:hypothetical protein ZIOFF_005636 [Zingiber officinale]